MGNYVKKDWTLDTFHKGDKEFLDGLNHMEQGIADAGSGTGVYKYKGTKENYADLPTSGNEVGDVWNVVNAYEHYPAGTNFAWTGTAWDALGGSVDLSVFRKAADQDVIDNSIKDRVSAIENDYLKAADKTDLQNNITQEVNDRTTAINTVNESINQEALAREQADTTLQNNINLKQDIISDLADIRDGAAKGKTALQEHQDISGKANVGDSYLKTESDAKYLTEHQDISGKQDKLTSANAGNSITIVEANLPTEYQEVEYLEATGTQYIKTEYLTNANTNIELQFLPISSGSGWQCLFGYKPTYMVSANTNNYSILFQRPNKLLGLTYRNVDTGGISGATISETDKNIVYNNGKSFYLNNRLVYTFTDFTTAGTSEAYLLASHDADSVRKPATYFYIGKIYYCKITENSSVVRHMIPCYRKSDSKSGMYDIITKKFYTNAATTGNDFTVGPGVFPVVKISYVNNNNYQTAAQVSSAVSTHNSSTEAHTDIRNSISSKQDKLTAGTNITIENNVISATAGESITFDDKTIIKGSDNKYQTVVGGWKETTPEQTTALFIDTKGDGSHTYIGPGSSDKYEVGWDYNTTITSLVGSATDAIVNIKFTVLGTTFNNRVTLYKQQTIPYKWQSNEVSIGNKEYVITVHDQYVGVNNGGIVVAAVDESADLSAATMEACSVITGSASTVYHQIDSNFINVDNTSVILNNDSKVAVNPNLELTTLTTTGTASLNGSIEVRKLANTKNGIIGEGCLVLNRGTAITENAIGDKAVILGDGCVATDEASIAAGKGARAGGSASMAINKDTKAMSKYSFAQGIDTFVSGINSQAFGNLTAAIGGNQTVIGKLNIPDATDNIFIVGNGTEEGKKTGRTEAAELIGFHVINKDQTGYSQRYIEITADNCQSIWDNTSITTVYKLSNAFAIDKDGNASLKLQHIELTGTSGTLTDEQFNILDKNSDTAYITLSNIRYNFQHIAMGRSGVIITFSSISGTLSNYIDINLSDKRWNYYSKMLQEQLAEAPDADGTYVWKCVVSGGVKTYQWVKED